MSVSLDLLRINSATGHGVYIPKKYATESSIVVVLDQGLKYVPYGENATRAEYLKVGGVYVLAEFGPGALINRPMAVYNRQAYKAGTKVSIGTDINGECFLKDGAQLATASANQSVGAGVLLGGTTGSASHLMSKLGNYLLLTVTALPALIPTDKPGFSILEVGVSYTAGPEGRHAH